MSKKHCLFLVFILLLSACAPVPQVTVTSEVTVISTATPVPTASHTITPTSSPTPVPTDEMPAKTPSLVSKTDEEIMAMVERGEIPASTAESLWNTPKDQLPDVIFFDNNGDGKGEILRAEMDHESVFAQANQVTYKGVEYGQDGVKVWKDSDGNIEFVLWQYIPTDTEATELMSVALAGRLIVLQPVGTGGRYDFSQYTASEVETDLAYAASNATNQGFKSVVNSGGTVIVVNGLKEHMPESRNVAGVRVYWEGVDGRVSEIYDTAGSTNRNYTADVRGGSIVLCTTFFDDLDVGEYANLEGGKYIPTAVASPLTYAAMDDDNNKDFTVIQKIYLHLRDSMHQAGLSWSFSG